MMTKRRKRRRQRDRRKGGGKETEGMSGDLGKEKGMQHGDE